MCFQLVVRALDHGMADACLESPGIAKFISWSGSVSDSWLRRGPTQAGLRRA